jgi:hypothetical protein
MGDHGTTVGRMKMKLEDEHFSYSIYDFKFVIGIELIERVLHKSQRKPLASARG